MKSNKQQSTRKILNLSTPMPVKRDLVFESYLKGGQQKFFIHCQNCNTSHEILFKDPHQSTYICKKCGAEIYKYYEPQPFISGYLASTYKKMPNKVNKNEINTTMALFSIASISVTIIAIIKYFE